MRLPISRAHRIALPAAALLALSAACVAAQPGYLDLVSVDYGTRLQPPSLRLDAMGGLGLSVRDEYTELNLWDFAGLPIELPEDRDSTSLDLWFDRSGLVLDRLEGGAHREIDRRSAADLAGEGILRSGRGAVGADFGYLTLQRGTPFADSEHVNDKITLPVFRPVATGRLWRGLRWGLSALVGQERSETSWWRDQVSETRRWRDEVTGARVKLSPLGFQVTPPTLFTPDEGTVGLSGGTISLGYRHPRWGSLGVYYDRRWERIKSNLDANRSLYELSEPRDWTGFGAAAILSPRPDVNLGVMAGREYYRGLQEYRFTLSGGSNADAFVARGNRQRDDGRQDFFQVRVQGDAPGTRLTYGAAFKVAYSLAIQNPAIEPDGSDFNTFVTRMAAADTLVAPSLVYHLDEASRRLEWGMGASYRLLADRARIGAEYHGQRDARIGTDLGRRSRDWQLILGGEYQVSPGWSALLGYRRWKSDYDVYTLRNEDLMNRASVGAVGTVLRKWRLLCELTDEWHRTDYPDPLETGGSGLGFGLQLTRGF